MVTAANDRESLEEALHLGIIDYLVKPFTFERFQIALDKFVAQIGALKQIETVEAAGQTVEFVQKDGALNIMLPEELPQDMPVCIKAKLK